jgi:hypothetical protein
MNERTLTKLLRRIDDHWPGEHRAGTPGEWLEQLAHVLPTHANRAVAHLAAQGGAAPTAELIAELAAAYRTEEAWARAAKLEPLPETGWVPLTWRAQVRRFPLVHGLWNLTHRIGLRDRLRCPSCTAVGTWKPYGDLWSRIKDGDRPVRRWLCKNCGRYEGPEGITRAWPRKATKVWVVESPELTDRDPTPYETLRDLGAWPWR